MKKLTSVLLVLIMVLAMSVSVFAGSVEGLVPGGDQVIPVEIEFVDGAKTTTIYSVEVTWEDLTFTFTNGDEKVWNPETHQYSDTTEDGWSAARKITVNNHSNEAVKAKAVFNQNNELEYTNAGATMTITCNMAMDSENMITLENAAEQAPGAPAGNPGHTLATFTVTPSGEVEADQPSFGSVIVMISAI